MATDQFSLPDNIHQQLRSLNGKIRALTSIRGLGVGLTICVAMLAGFVLLDWLLDLPQFVRFGLLGIFCVGSVACLARAVMKPLLQRFDSNELAALLEAGNPDLRESISSAIELNDESVPEEYRGSKWMRTQLAGQAASAVRSADPGNAVSPASSIRGLTMGLVAVVLLAMPFMVWPSSSRLMASRFFQPWKNLDRPSNLYFDVLDGNRVIAHGSDARIVAIPRWRESEEELPETVLVNWSFAGGDSGSKRMNWDEGQGAYQAEIRHVVADFDYHIASGSGRSKNYHIQAVTAPLLETLLLDVEPPPYSGLPAEHHDGIIGEVRAFERSNLRFSMTFNKPVQEANFLWSADAAGQDVPAQTLPLVVAADGLAASFEMAAIESGSFVVRLRDEAGLTNAQNNKRDLFVIKDGAPSVRIDSGTKVQSVRPDAVVEVAVTSSDDIGLGELSLHYFVEETEAGSIPFPELSKGARRVNHVFVMDLAELNIPEGTAFSYMIQAADERPIPQPNISQTETRQLNISADADTLDKQELAEQQERLRDKIKDISQQVTKARRETRDLKIEARQAESRKEAFAEDKRIAELASEEFKLSEQLEEISQELEQHPLFAELADRAQDVSRKDLPKASEESGKAARETQLDKKIDHLTEAEKSLTTAEWKLQNLAEKFDQLSGLEQDLAQLDQLARDTNELADDVEALEDQRQEAAAEEDAAAREQQLQDIVDKQNELINKQQEIAEDLDDLAERRPELVDAARKAQMEKLKQIADEARELADQEGHLANSFQDEAKRNQKESRSVLQKAREAQRRVEQLEGDMKKQGLKEPIDAAPVKDAVEELRRGNFQNPERVMRETAEQLQQKSKEIGEGKSEGGEKVSEEQREKLSKAAQQASDKALEVAEDLRRLVEAREDTRELEDSQLAQKQRELSDAAEKLAAVIKADRGEKSDSAKAAGRAAEAADRAADLAKAGIFKPASESAEAAARDEQDSGEQLGKDGDARSQNLSQSAKKLSEAQKEVAKQLADAADDPAAARKARQEGQQDAAQKMQELARELAEASEQLNSNPVDMPAQGDKAQQAQQAAEQAEQQAQQASKQAQESDSGKASESAREAAKKIQEAANKAQQASNGQVKDTPVPEDVGEQFAKAIKSVQEAGKELGQKPGTQETGDQTGQKPGDEKGQEPGKGEQGKGEGQQGKGKDEGQKPGDQGKGKQGEAGKKGEGKGKSMGSQQLRDAAKQMQQAARNALPKQGEGNKGQQGTSRTGENNEAGGNTEANNGRLEELLGLNRDAREWGKLPGHLQTEILQGAKRNPGGDYAKQIRMYFREIAKATDGPAKPEPPKADK